MADIGNHTAPLYTGQKHVTKVSTSSIHLTWHLLMFCCCHFIVAILYALSLYRKFVINIYLVFLYAYSHAALRMSVTSCSNKWNLDLLTLLLILCCFPKNECVENRAFTGVHSAYEVMRAENHPLKPVIRQKFSRLLKIAALTIFAQFGW